jgi:hypothetical protein
MDRYHFETARMPSGRFKAAWVAQSEQMLPANGHLIFDRKRGSANPIAFVLDADVAAHVVALLNSNVRNGG